MKISKGKRAELLRVVAWQALLQRMRIAGGWVHDQDVYTLRGKCYCRGCIVVRRSNVQ
jgi:hypothetical protein